MGWGKSITIEVSRGESTVDFEAIGRPSMLKIHGKSTKHLEGTLVVSGTSVTGSCAFDLESLDTGLSMRDDHMKHTYLETQKYPQASLKFTQLTLSADLSGIDLPFEGELTFHGVTKPVKGKAAFTPQANLIQIKAHFEIALDDFSIRQPTFSGITMAKIVKVDVSVKAPIQADLAAKPSADNR